MYTSDAIEAKRAAQFGAGFREGEQLVASRSRNRDYVLRRLLLAADLSGILLAMILSFTVVSNRDDPMRDALVMAPVLVAWALILRSYRLYDRRVRSVAGSGLDDVAPLFHAVVLGTLATWLFSKLALGSERLVMHELLVFAVAAMALISALRTLVLRVHLRALGPEEVLVVASEKEVCELRKKFARHPGYGMHLRGAIIPDADPDKALGFDLHPARQDLDRLIDDRAIDHLMVQAGPGMGPGEIVRLMRLCHSHQVRFSVVPANRQTFNPGAEIDRIEGLGVLVYHPPVLSASSQFLKRCLDVAVSAVSMLLLAPMMPLIALAIRLDSPGPILFKQTRVGRNGSRFRMLKFRTMVRDAEQLADELMVDSKDPDCLMLDQDPRVTRVGRFLRVTSLDETPQLWNVLRGDMSLVGPRPLPERDDRIVEGWSRHRLDLRPGLTGPWQVLGRNDIPFREMVDIDNDYSADWSLWGDIRLMIRTVPAVIGRRGSN
jgi:exopolysaccharide biosynthesis polyprenyl glycosylphosphotransferase